MKHGVAFRKFSRTSSHRMLMLRNLVTSLFEHEQIKTTLPKARDTARLAEKIITMGKRGDVGCQTRASAFLLKPIALNKLFDTFAQRYADRPGGYTRILKLGNRKGDNAPQAVLELVDNPKDLRWEMTARAVGWELLKKTLSHERLNSIVKSGAEGANEIIEAERKIEFGSKRGILRPKTRWNVQKILKFRRRDAAASLSQKATEYADELLATPLAFKALHQEMKEKDFRNSPPRPIAGQRHLGDTRPVLDLAHGKLGHIRPEPKSPVLDMRTAFGRKYK